MKNASVSLYFEWTKEKNRQEKYIILNKTKRY